MPKVYLNVSLKVLKVKFFCIFLPSGQKMALKSCIFTKINSKVFNFIHTSFDKFFETGKFEEKSHIVHCRLNAIKCSVCLQGRMMRRQTLIFLTYLYDDYENFSSALGHNSWANAQFDGTSGKSNACAGPSNWFI